MIYLKNTTDPQVVRIPVSLPKLDGIVTLRLVNTIDRGPAVDSDFDQAVYLVDALGAYVHDADGKQVAVADIGDTSRLYYVLNVVLPDDMPEGEYEYTATVGDVTVSCGLAILGERETDTEQYENTVTYEQYRQ
jgi:hypothetical protein